MLSRRQLLAALAAAGIPPAVPMAFGATEYGAVVRRLLEFPRDHGAHPEFRTEWWYLTGWLHGESAKEPLGFQVTFFRVRPGVAEDNPSAFAARQLLLAHAAVADPAVGALVHDERIARAGFDVVSAATGDTDLRLDRWTFRRNPATGRYRTVIPAAAFELILEAEPTQPLLLQGDGGFSAKGPLPAQASHYYSEPQLKVTGTLARDGVRRQVRGTGWLDHEWSSSPLAASAVGWDWVGMNLADGGALTAFQIRPRTAGAPPVHAYASLRGPDGGLRLFGPGEVAFTPLETWTSPRTRATWPVAQAIRVGDRRFTTRPLMADQELDSRRTTGAVYWEGASTLLENNAVAGRGYLEMTGYLEPIRL